MKKLLQVFSFEIIDRVTWIGLIATGIYLGIQVAIVILQALL